jgi:hypothetical protein
MSALPVVDTAIVAPSPNACWGRRSVRAYAPPGVCSRVIGRVVPVIEIVPADRSALERRW